MHAVKGVVVCVRVPWYTHENVKNSLWELVLSLYHEDSGDQIKAMRLNGKHPDLLSVSPAPTCILRENSS